MKKIVVFTASAILFGTLFLSSCSKKEDDPAPTTPTSADPRAKFHGNWSVSETSVDFGPSTYNCTVSDSSDATHILFAYIYGFNKKASATVSGNNFTIPAQTIQGNNVTGAGVLTNANQINMTYLVQTTASHYDTVRAVLTK